MTKTTTLELSNKLVFVRLPFSGAIPFSEQVLGSAPNVVKESKTKFKRKTK